MLLLRHHLVLPVHSPFLLPLAPTRLNYQSASSTKHLLYAITHLPSLVSVLHHRYYLSVPAKAADIASCACRRKPASIQADQGALPAPANAVKGSNSPNNLSGAEPNFKPLRSTLDQQFHRTCNACRGLTICCWLAGADAARAFATALRASIESQAQEGGDTSAELHKQVASRKRLAKMFVVRAPCLRTLLVHVSI